MLSNFTRNIHFTRLIKAAGYLREFNFRKLNTSPEPLFHVDVSDDRGNRIMFKMTRGQSGWQFVPQQLPSWVENAEGDLSRTIDEEMG